MTLWLISWENKIADEEIQCQAGALLWAYTRNNRGYQPPFDVIVMLNKTVDLMIKKGERYTAMEFVD